MRQPLRNNRFQHFSQNAPRFETIPKNALLPSEFFLLMKMSLHGPIQGYQDLCDKRQQTYLLSHAVLITGTTI
jgi:hypothetical protein